MESQSYDVDSTTGGWTKSAGLDHSARFDPNEMPTVNSTNPHYNPAPLSSNGSLNESAVHKAATELKKGQQHAEDIITKSKRVLQNQCKCKRADCAPQLTHPTDD